MIYLEITSTSSEYLLISLVKSIMIRNCYDDLFPRSIARRSRSQSRDFSKSEVAMHTPPTNFTCVQCLSSFLFNIKKRSKPKEDHDTSILQRPALVSYQQNTQYATNDYPFQRPPSSPPAPRSVSANTHRPECPTKRPKSFISCNSPIPTTQQSKSLASLLPVSNTNVGQVRAVSSPVPSRPALLYCDNEASGEKISKRKSWLPAREHRSCNALQELSSVAKSNAWVITGNGHLDYCLDPLVNGDKVYELWDLDETADTYVYLFSNGHRPSFKVPSLVFSSSQRLFQLSKQPGAQSLDSVRGQSNLPLGVQQENATGGCKESVSLFPEAQRTNMHLYFPVQLSSYAIESQPSQQDVQDLVDIRNLFAFLTSQPLVGTLQVPSRFHILLSISVLLWKFNFKNFDGSTYGEAVSDSFSFYIRELNLGDVRESREKIIEGLILGERFKSIELYQEAFAHAVGKYDGLKQVNPNLFNSLPRSTVYKLERAFLNLQQRQTAVNRHLVDFAFPSIFSGIANSTSRPEAKFVNFRAWKSNFNSMRGFVRSYYKALHGQWPPKVRSMKNPFVGKGLNRLVLKDLYNDFCGLYDLLVDRDDLTTQTVNQSNLPTSKHPGEWEQDKLHTATASALRTVFAEYNTSSPPVWPSIPYDTPIIPNMAALDPYFEQASGKDQQKLLSRKIRDSEQTLLLSKSHNYDVSTDSRFLTKFLIFEVEKARGKNCHELTDMRYGHWIFLYAVIQCLPMLVIDTPGVKYSDGVEYFLCEPPVGGLPWLSEVDGTRKEWYGIGDSNTVVSMPSNIVDYGLEATYNRSHCWIVAQKWFAALDSNTRIPPLPLLQSEISGSDSFPEKMQRSYDSDRNAKRRSIVLSLNKLPISENISPAHTLISAGLGAIVPIEYDDLANYNSNRMYSSGRERCMSSDLDSSGSNFEDILKNIENDDGKKKKRK